MSVNNYYELSLELLDKFQFTPTLYPTTGRVENGNLLPFKARLELVNTGNSKTDNGVLTLRVPPDGTFVRTEPILTNEEAKDRFIIQAQIRQNDGAGGIRYGKIFRFIVGSPTIQDDVNGGETLKLSLIPVEYRLKEHLTSKQLLFFSPRKAFEKRLEDYNITKGTFAPEVVFSADNVDPADDSIQLPNDDENLKQPWEPIAPTKTHDLLWEIINRLSQPSVSGGTFQDYYFDFEANSVPPFSGDRTNGNIDKIDIRAGIFGGIDSGIILDPLSLSSPVDAEKDKTIISDLVRYKDNIIAEGSPNGGSLPMEKTRFNSAWQHAQARAEYSGGATYYNNEFKQSVVKRTDTSPFSGKQYVRFFKYIGTDNSSANDPISIGQTDWYEDFTTIPEYSDKAQYEEFEIVTYTSGGSITFYELLPVSLTAISGTGTVTVTTSPAHGLTTGNFVDIEGTTNFNVKQVRVTVTGTNTFTYSHAGNGIPESYGIYDAWVRRTRVHYKGDAFPNSKWSNAFNDIAEAQHEPFYSYSPWTSDYYLQLANLSGVPSIPNWNAGVNYLANDEVQHGGSHYVALFDNIGSMPPSINWALGSTTVPTWIGAVPDYNFERANFDRIKSEDQFEQISLKAVVRAERNSANITTQEKINGARFLITDGFGGIGQNDFAGHTNQIAEWYQPPFVTTGEWRFSKTPSGNTEIVTDLQLAHVWKWTGTAWENFWNPNLPRLGRVTSPFHPVSNGDELSLNPVNPSITKTGFGLVGGSTGIPAQAIRLTYHWDQVFGSSLNLASRGAWWVQHLPMPRLHGVGGRTLGDTYKNSTLDTTNLDLDRKGQQGWNNGLDSEDLGRINALTMKVRLSAYDDQGNLCNGYANMPFKAWAIDVFGRIWFENFTVSRNGQYDHVRIAFGNNSPSKLYHNRIDELFGIWGFTFSQNFFLKEKEFTGIAFDWRFVKSWGIFWNVSYDDNGMYTGVRDQFVDTVGAWAKQVANNTLSYYTAGNIPKETYIIDHASLDIDELAFEKQLYANSDDITVDNARTELINIQQEKDYLNLKIRAKGERARKKFVNQQWHMLAHGDVRMRLGHKFKITGSRVPEQTSNYTAWNSVPTYSITDKVSRGGYVWQSLRNFNTNKIPENEPLWWVNLNESVCADVKHIIDSDGYTMQVLGVRKFVYGE